MKPNTKKYDVVVLTDNRYVNPIIKDAYIDNLLLEDKLIADALINNGHHVTRVSWDDPTFDWATARFLLLRSTWDYSDRIEEFMAWMNRVSQECQLINSAAIVRWNIDKRYLQDLKANGVEIVPTHYVLQGESASLKSVCSSNNWNDIVIKPVISCAGRETYRVKSAEREKYEAIFNDLVQSESMMVQPFIKSIESKGEISMMVFGGKYSHAVLKKAKEGDFRVQDDFGGTVHDYDANEEEIAFAEHVVHACKTLPYYARVDCVWDEEGNLCVSELELIEPELWFRNKPNSAKQLADFISDSL